jgi:enamine deaminase RidA (YjgF/YER057c/UK114 family)
LVWNLRHELPGVTGGGARGEVGPLAAQPPAGGRGGGPQGPAVVPGEYAVRVQAGDKVLTGTVAVTLDPAVQATPAELDAQAQASFEALALVARVNDVISRVDSMSDQLTALDAQLARQSPAPPVRGQVKQVIAALKKFRDEDLARPLPGLGYRQYPRLREDVQSLAGYLGRGVRAPNDGEVVRMKDLTAQVDQAVAKVNAIIAKDIAAINDAMKSAPRISVDAIR